MGEGLRIRDLSQNLKDKKEKVMGRTAYAGRVFSTEGTASAKALRQEQSSSVERMERRPEWLECRVTGRVLGGVSRFWVKE